MNDDGWIVGEDRGPSGVVRPALSPPVIECIEAVRAYLHQHASEPVTLATLSRVAALSPFYLV